MSTGTSAWAPPTNGGVPPHPASPQQVPPYGWNPPPAGGPPGPGHQGSPRPPRMWLWALTTTVLMVVAVAATAAITYAITRSAARTPTAAAPTTSAPTFTAAQQADAKQALCHTFDVSTTGMQSQGGARMDGKPNLPLLVRMVTSTVSIQNAIVPATSEDLARLAERVVATNLDVMNAAMGQTNIDEVNRLNDVSNEATYALADACGLPH